MRTYAQQRRRERLAEIIAGVIELAIKASTAVFFAYIFAWVLLNWFMGCGESFVQADGSRLQGECLAFIPWRW